MPAAGPTPVRKRSPFPDEVARALADQANLARLAALDPADFGLRDIWETIIVTGRRVSEVLRLRLDCTGRYGGLAMLWHDQTKVGRYDQAIRIPEWLSSGSRRAGKPPWPGSPPGMAAPPDRRAGGDGAVPRPHRNPDGTAADAVASAAFGSAGQRCMAISAVVTVGRETGDALVRGVVERGRELIVGPGSDGDSQMGPLVTSQARARVTDYIARGEHDGATVALDGRERFGDDEPGFFIGPSVLDHVTTEMDVYRDEVFGPLLVVLRADSFEQALTIVNANPYGNGAAIFTNDGGVAREFRTRVTAGMVGINVPIPVPTAPFSFGGWKDSLFGDLQCTAARESCSTPEPRSSPSAGPSIARAWTTASRARNDAADRTDHRRRAMTQTTLIANGTVVTAEGEFDGDVLIEGEKIAAVGRVGAPDGTDVIDATGCFVLPGLIDNHTHLSMPFMGTMSIDDYNTGTRAAAAGGVTCLVDFAIQQHPDDLQSTLDEWRGRADGAAHVDYGFHMAITNASDPVIEEMAAMTEAGICSFKLFMAYKGALMVRDDELAACMERARDLGALTMVHAENGDIVDLLVKRALARGETSAIHHALTRPEWVEAEATGRAARIAEQTGASLFVVHVTCAAAAAEVDAAQQRGAAVTGETCVQYLTNGIDDLRHPGVEGCRYICSPPLRDISNHEPLWGYLRRGVLESISTDHCPFNDEQKSRGLDDFSLVPNGLALIQHRLAQLWDEGVVAGTDHPLAARRPHEHDDRPTVRPARKGRPGAREGRRRRRARPGGASPVRQGHVVHERQLRPLRRPDGERQRAAHVLARDTRLRPGRDKDRARARSLRPADARGLGPGRGVTELRLDPQAVIADLDELADQSGGRFAGANRLAWTPQWMEARAWSRSKLEEIGLEPTLDQAGNMWAPSTATTSHS